MGLTWVQARLAPSEGGLTVFLEDVSVKASVEMELRRDRDLLNAVIESTTDAVFVKDLQGRYVLLNCAAARAFGRPAEDVLGRTDTELLGPHAAAATVAHDRGVVRGRGDGHL